MTIGCGGVVAIQMARLGVRVVILRWRWLLSIRSHLVRVPFRSCRTCGICGRSAFEVGQLLHPCREWATTAWSVWAIWHFSQLFGRRYVSRLWVMFDNFIRVDKEFEEEAHFYCSWVRTMYWLCTLSSSHDEGVVKVADKGGCGG